LSLSPAVTGVIPQSSSITACSAGRWNRAPVPKSVFRSRMVSNRSRCLRSRSAGSSNTVIIIRHAMSTPTAYGMTHPCVASTPPIGSPYPTCASAISAPATDTGSRHAAAICACAPSSIPSAPQVRYGTGSSRATSAAARAPRATSADASSAKIGSETDAAGSASTRSILSLISDPTRPARAAAAHALIAAGMAWSGTPRFLS
jgi:hypothetical protein